MVRRILVVLLFVFVIFQGTSDGFAQSRVDFEAQNYFLKGAFLEEWNELTYAYTFYKAAVEKCPESGRLKLALTRVAVNLGKFDEAKEYAGALIKDEEYEDEAAIYMAEANYRMGNALKSAENLESIEAKLDDMRRNGVLSFLARIYFELKDEKNARITLEKLKVISPNDLFANYRLGLFYAQDGETEKAMECFRAVLLLKPDFSNLPVLFSSLLIQEERREEAKQVLENAYEVNPAGKEVRNALFEMLSEDKEYARGIDLMLPLFEQDILDVEGIIRLGRYYFEKGDMAGALVVYRKLLEKKCNKAAVLKIVADLEIEFNNFRNASEDLKELVELSPDDFFNYTGLLFMAHDLTAKPSTPEQKAVISSADSARYMNAAVKIVEKDSARQNYLMGLIFAEAGDNDKALEFLLHAEKLKPGDKKITLELARILEESGRFSKALAMIKKIYDSNSEDPTLINYYGYLLALNGDRLDFAEELLSKVLKLDPENGYYLDSLGWIKFKKGEYDNALKILLDAADSVEDDPTIWEHIGDTYVRLQAMSKAEKAYRKSVKLNPRSLKVLEKLREISTDEAEK